MNPLLRQGDTLLVVPYDAQKIQPGDVITFPDHRNGGQVVHRVVAVTAEGVITKGDNNPNLDDKVLAPHEILGRVAAIQRQGRTLPVPREAPAALYLLKARRWFHRTVSPLLHSFYHRLAESRLFRGCLPAGMKPRLICFSRPDGPEWQLWLGKLLIGRKMPHQARWTIQWPFRLFIDEACLPD